MGTITISQIIEKQCNKIYMKMKEWEEKKWWSNSIFGCDCFGLALPWNVKVTKKVVELSGNVSPIGQFCYKVHEQHVVCRWDKSRKTTEIPIQLALNWCENFQIKNYSKINQHIKESTFISSKYHMKMALFVFPVSWLLEVWGLDKTFICEWFYDFMIASPLRFQSTK